MLKIYYGYYITLTKKIKEEHEKQGPECPVPVNSYLNSLGMLSFKV